MANEDPAYLAFVRSLSCAMRLHDPCDGLVEAHHTGSRGLSQRAHDRTAIPLCRYHHQCRHNASGPFRHFDKAKFRQWSEDQVRRTRKRWRDTPREDRPQLCPECSVIGHSLEECPRRIEEEEMPTRPEKARAQPVTVVPVVSSHELKDPPPGRRCSCCGQPGHNKRSCPVRHERRALIKQRAKAQKEPR